MKPVKMMLEDISFYPCLKPRRKNKPKFSQNCKNALLEFGGGRGLSETANPESIKIKTNILNHTKRKASTTMQLKI